MKKARPLIQKGIVEIEGMFKDSQHDLVTLKQLRAELKHRKLARARALLKKVEEALDVAKRLSDIEPETTQVLDSPSSSIERVKRSRSTKVVKEPVDKTKATRTVTAVSAHQHVTVMPEQAWVWDVLGVASSSSWEVIEHARRTLVERSRPDCIADLNEEDSQKRLNEAKRVNQAYAILVRVRMGKGDITL